MNNLVPAYFRRLKRNAVFDALLVAAAIQAHATPIHALLFGPPEISATEHTSDTHIWRYVPWGQRGGLRAPGRHHTKLFASA